MGNKAKKLLSIVAAATLLSSLALTACGKDYHKSNKLDGYVSTETAAVSNGGFAVEKGEYIYFINGVENYTAGNKYGDVVKGALMRAKKADLASGNYANVDTVVPQLFVSQNFKSGIYIYGDHVYYATPTTDKNADGKIANTYIDFKSAKLDGTEAMKGYYFRLSNNASKYRFVEVDGVVYCMYEEDSALKSYNTKTGVTTVLVKGASSFFYDEKDLTNPNVYYMMNVSYNLDTDMATKATYNQIYSVNAASTVSVDASKAAYTVNVYNETTDKMEAYKTYDFDESYLESKNEEAKETAKKNNKKYEAVYDFKDYTTYPYVNLGTLVVDGMGRQCETTPYNVNDATTILGGLNDYTLKGYTYTIARYENGGVYYTRTDEMSVVAKLYYYDGDAANAIVANTSSDVIAWDTKEASSTALFLKNGDEHGYIFVDSTNSKIVKVKVGANGEKAESVNICSVESGATLWKTEGEHLYYYAAGSNPVTGAATSGYRLTRIKYTGDETLGNKVYENLPNVSANAEYKPTAIQYVDFANSWYMPETFGNVLLYANAEAIGTSSYNYIYATTLGTADEIVANNEKYEEVYKHIEEDFENSDVQAALTYYYRTGSQAAIDEVKALFEKEIYDEEQYELFNDFVEDVTAGKYITESKLIGLVSKINDADKDAMAEGWTSTLPKEKVTEEEEKGLPTWAICLIVAGGVLVVAAAVIIPLMIVRKKKIQQAEADATVNAYKRKKIDTTDDKTIDVYATEEGEVSESETNSEE